MSDMEDIAILASFDVQNNCLIWNEKLRDEIDSDTDEKIKYILSATEQEKFPRSTEKEREDYEDEESEVIIENITRNENKSMKNNQEWEEDMDEILKFTCQMMDMSNKLTVTKKMRKEPQSTPGQDEEAQVDMSTKQQIKGIEQEEMKCRINENAKLEYGDVAKEVEQKRRKREKRRKRKKAEEKDLMVESQVKAFRVEDDTKAPNSPTMKSEGKENWGRQETEGKGLVYKEPQMANEIKCIDMKPYTTPPLPSPIDMKPYTTPPLPSPIDMKPYTTPPLPSPIDMKPYTTPPMPSPIRKNSSRMMKVARWMMGIFCCCRKSATDE